MKILHKYYLFQFKRWDKKLYKFLDRFHEIPFIYLSETTVFNKIYNKKEYFCKKFIETF
jgi:hypothetical protein